MQTGIMKFILCLALVAIFAVAVKADTCRQNSDCSGTDTHTHCTGDGWTLQCASGYCTCSTTQSSSQRCDSDRDCELNNSKCPGTLRWRCYGWFSYKSCHCSRRD